MYTNFLFTEISTEQKPLRLRLKLTRVVVYACPIILYIYGARLPLYSQKQMRAIHSIKCLVFNQSLFNLCQGWIVFVVYS